jgi:hypothetical protein
VSGVHGLEHIEGFATAAFADDDAVWSHTESIANEVCCGHAATSFDVWRSGFEAEDVFLLELEFGGVFDGDDAVIIGDEAGEGIEECGFSGASSAADDDIEACFHGAFEEHDHFGGEGAEFEKVFESEWVASEAADGERGAIEGERGDDGIETGAIGEPGIDHGRCFVDSASDFGDDAIEDLEKMFVVSEGDIRPLDAAVFFNEHILGSVDHDIGDAFFLEKDFERSESEGFIENFFDKAFSFGAIEEWVFGIAEVFDDDANFAAEGVAFEFGDAIEVEFFNKFPVDVRFEGFEVGGGLPIRFIWGDHGGAASPGSA